MAELLHMGQTLQAKEKFLDAVPHLVDDVNFYQMDRIVEGLVG